MLVLAVMTADDRERWNARWRAREQPIEEPSPWVVSIGSLLPTTGRALDAAGGAGRHAIWLARRGLDVTLVDVSDEAIALAARAADAAGVRIACVRADFDVDPLPPGPWDAIVCVHFLDRALLGRLAAALAPGGTIAFCQPTRRNLERHPQPGAAYLLDEGEAPGLFAGLDILVYDEGWLDAGRHEARVVARRPTLPP